MLSTMGAMLVAALLIDLFRDLSLKKEAVAVDRFSDRLLVNLLFFTMIPGSLYTWLYPLIPFGGLRAGFFLAIVLFLLAVAPTLAAFRVRAPNAVPLTLGHLFWLLFKYLVVYGLLGYLYQP